MDIEINLLPDLRDHEYEVRVTNKVDDMLSASTSVPLDLDDLRRLYQLISVVLGHGGIIEELDAIAGDDPEVAHSQADGLLLEAVPTEIRDAYKRLVDRCEWWVDA